MKKILILIICLHGLPQLYAQERAKEISLMFGPYHQATLDAQASPLLYKTHNSNSAAFYLINRGTKSRFQFKLHSGWGSYSPERFKSRTYGDDNYVYSITPTLYALQLKLAYLRKINAALSSTNWQLFVGAELSNGFLLSDQIANTFWATNLAGLNATVLAEWQPIRQHSLTAQVSIPALAIVSRANYANYAKSTHGTNLTEFFHQGSDLVTLNKLQQINLEAKYNYQLSRRFGLGALYQFSWFHYPDPRPIRSYSQALLLQTSYRFKFKN
ncbi:hypothetical protein AHMF7605_04110 [Adhaeribacter arboris]|uniref:Outer membrane protein beta-barrel domain-containing protein n=1 Tax=Adhaeribacter arboris TaxID=2072846 RepID=A0A2T2YB71_9BACT|nr:hypothetical protein [Adhaeribacter arboris]PSR52762.1 hypothetical protein AHMF7605_04110 [Adhaeribacter arboris]